jgi:hypothetical protein
MQGDECLLHPNDQRQNRICNSNCHRRQHSIPDLLRLDPVEDLRQPVYCWEEVGGKTMEQLNANVPIHVHDRAERNLARFLDHPVKNHGFLQQSYQNSTVPTDENRKKYPSCTVSFENAPSPAGVAVGGAHNVMTKKASRCVHLRRFCYQTRELQSYDH